MNTLFLPSIYTQAHKILMRAVKCVFVEVYYRYAACRDLEFKYV